MALLQFPLYAVEVGGVEVEALVGDDCRRTMSEAETAAKRTRLQRG